MFPDKIVIPRFRFRTLSRMVVDPLNAYDHFAVSRSDTIEEETKFVTQGPHEAPEETLEFPGRTREGHKSVESAVYAAFPHGDENGAGEFAGTTGLNPKQDKCRAVFGMWLHKEFWGRDYFGKWVIAFFAVVFDMLDLDMVLAYAMPENEVSCQVAEKYTNRFDEGEDDLFPNETVDTGGTPRGAHGWSVTRRQWETVTNGDYNTEFRWSLDPDDAR